MPTSEFAYFDGREWCAHEVRASEAHAVELERETAATIVHDVGRQRDTTVWVEPPERALYPRPVESIAEARALYVTDEIEIGAYEHYLEGLIDADE